MEIISFLTLCLLLPSVLSAPEDLQSINVNKLPADIEEKVFPVGPTGEVSVRIYRPVGATGFLPE